MNNHSTVENRFVQPDDPQSTMLYQRQRGRRGLSLLGSAVSTHVENSSLKVVKAKKTNIAHGRRQRAMFVRVPILSGLQHCLPVAAYCTP